MRNENEAVLISLYYITQLSPRKSKPSPTSPAMTELYADKLHVCDLKIVH